MATVRMSGQVLAGALHDMAISHGDLEGLLFGFTVTETVETLEDGQVAGPTTTTTTGLFDLKAGSDVVGGVGRLSCSHIGSNSLSLWYVPLGIVVHFLSLIDCS